MNNEQKVTDAVKDKVLARQKGRSISGLFLTDVNFHHFITVGSRGVGYEWNIVALTPSEHRELHDGADITVNGKKRFTNAEFKSLIRNHLILHYLGWSEDKCRFHRGWSEEDYEVQRIEPWKFGKR